MFAHCENQGLLHTLVWPPAFQRLLAESRYRRTKWQPLCLACFLILAIRMRALKTTRLAREQATLSRMVDIYCEAHHAETDTTPCESCVKFLSYAERRLQKCPYGEDKPTCTNCPVHCYKAKERALAKDIMRYAGPKMLLRHPWLAIAHLLDGRRRAKHPRELTRELRLRPQKPPADQS